MSPVSTIFTTVCSRIARQPQPGRRLRRTALSATAAAAVACVIAVAPASAAMTAHHCDFDGDGRDDQALGVPGESIAGVADMGAVSVIYGTAGGLAAGGDQLWHQGVTNVEGAPEPGDILGTALACGDFDDDGFGDLAMGGPGEDITGDANAGVVNVLYGTGGGLSAAGDQAWSQDSTSIDGTADSGDRFGSALATGDFDDDGFDDLAIGAPAEDSLAGSINVIYGSARGLTAAGDERLHQDTSGIGSAVAENGDRFGEALAAGDFDRDGTDDLAIGMPGEDVGSVGQAGAVMVLRGSASGLSTVGDKVWTQDTASVQGVAEARDRFGSALAAADFDRDRRDDLAIGVPSEEVAGRAFAGAVNVLYGAGAGLTATGDQLWSQDTAGITGDLEAFDRFGFSLTSGDFDDDGRADLAVGAPWDSIAGVVDTGAVNVLYGAASGLSAAGDDLWHQGVAGIAGDLEAHDQLGSSLAAGDFNGSGRDDLTIGVPGDSFAQTQDVGMANVLYGSGSGLRAAGDQLWHQDQPGIEGQAEPFDRLGGSLRSDGTYRIGFADGTQVRVSGDHLSHPPRERVDLNAVIEGSPIVAAASGRIEFIVDTNAEPTNRNNYVWISHPNGEWTKYSHFVTGSVTALGHSVGESVQAGTRLGIEGEVGRASGVHLHFEVAVPHDLANPITPGGFIIGENRDPVTCGIPGQTFLSGATYEAAAC